MHKYIYIVLCLKECLMRVTGYHYPNEIIELIILRYYEPIKINCGYLRTSLIKTNANGYIWGTDHVVNSNKPEKILLSNIESVEHGADHIIALTKCRDLYVWGGNNYGQLGLGDIRDRTLPHLMDLSGLYITKVSCCGYHTVIITVRNEIYIWGRNAQGQLGLGDNIKCNSPQKLNLPNAILVSCGWTFTMALTTSNKIYVWGDNQYGQLGLGDGHDRYVPTELFLSDILTIKCGIYHAVALSKYSKLFIWGSSDITKNIPQEFILEGILSVSAGYNRTMALTKFDEIYIWDSGYQSGPQKISLGKIISVSCGGYHFIAVTLYDEIYVWGSNGRGQLGLADNKDRNEPCRLDF